MLATPVLQSWGFSRPPPAGGRGDRAGGDSGARELGGRCAPASHLRRLPRGEGRTRLGTAARQRTGGAPAPHSGPRSASGLHVPGAGEAAGCPQWRLLPRDGTFRRLQASKRRTGPWAVPPRVAPSPSARDPTFLVSPPNCLFTNPDFLRA